MAAVLLIEDNDHLREILRDGLAAAGHAVLEAVNGADGIRLFDTARPDVVITDIVMDEGEGIGTIAEIRRRATDVPVIAISGNSVYLGYSSKLGANKTLEKPFPIIDLLGAIDDLTAATTDEPRPHA